MDMAPTLPAAVPMMAAMMLPSAIPALARRAREPDGLVAAGLFAGSYLGIWAVASVAMISLYRRPGAVSAGAVVVAAGLYELTPLKRECRRRCRERIRSGLRFGLYCLGSSIGLMLVLVAVNPMSIAAMAALSSVLLIQKLLPPHPVVDAPLALGLIALGLATAAT
jgi:predicted metal-binding membrane protein